MILHLRALTLSRVAAAATVLRQIPRPRPWLARSLSTTPTRLRQPDAAPSGLDPASVDRESDEVDVCIVGGGPAGLSAAIRLRQLASAAGSDGDGFRVVVLEKAAELGAHTLSGAVLQPDSLAELLPDWNAADNPARFQHATPASGDDRMRFLFTATSSIPLPVPPQMRNEGNYILSLGQLVGWLGERAEEAGAEVYPGFAGAEVLYGADGAVRGVATGDAGVLRSGRAGPSFQRGMEFRARATLFAEGCHGSLSKQLIRRFELRRDAEPQTYGLGLKEVWAVRPEAFHSGRIVHSMGYPLPPDTYGGGFMYHFGENLVSVGLVVALDYPNPWLSPYGEFQKMKTHPLYRDVLRGGRCLSYGARSLVEGGFQSLPRVGFPGGALIGDSAGFVNVPKVKGTHNAIRSGMLAAEAAWAALRQASPAPAAATGAGADGGEAVFLYDYERALRESSIWRELRAVRNLRPSFHSPLGVYGGLLYSGLDAFLLRGRVPWTWRHSRAGLGDHAATREADRCRRIEYPRPDGELTFDIATSVSRTGTGHAEDQPVHLRVADWDAHAAAAWPKYRGLENRFCPAGVYEYVEDEGKELGMRFQINAQNCIHCKTCDIKAPQQDIDWAVPQGGDGPKYYMM